MGSFDLFEHHMSQLPHGLPTAGSFDQRQMMTGSLQGVQHHGGAMLSTMLPKPAGAGWDPEYGMMKLQPEPPSYRSALPAAPANFGAAFGRGNQLNQADGSEDDDSPMFNFPMEAALRRERDAFLLSMRRKGHSYREIKRRGRFREAESTLRGRVRVLTKDKSQRVRKPEWTDDDVSHFPASSFESLLTCFTGEAAASCRQAPLPAYQRPPTRQSQGPEGAVEDHL